jgi:type IV secretion system protein VirB2
VRPMVPSASMFDAPAQGPIAAALAWIEGTLLGEAAVALCVIAVAILGFTMMTGRLPIRQGARVVLGCFILLGAPAIASGIAGSWAGGEGSTTVSAGTPRLVFEREELPPATENPYARASLRRD